MNGVVHPFTVPTVTASRMREPGGPTRRSFLKGMLAAGAAVGAGLPTFFADVAGAAAPLGPSDGVLLTDIEPDLGDDSVEDEPIGELDMDSEEVGTTDASVDMDAEDIDEDDLQEDFEDDTVADGDIDDADDTALRP